MMLAPLYSSSPYLLLTAQVGSGFARDGLAFTQVTQPAGPARFFERMSCVLARNFSGQLATYPSDFTTRAEGSPIHDQQLSCGSCVCALASDLMGPHCSL
eukprot:5813826-Amphidinium_carterae.1